MLKKQKFDTYRDNNYETVTWVSNTIIISDVAKYAIGSVTNSATILFDIWMWYCLN